MGVCLLIRHRHITFERLGEYWHVKSREQSNTEDYKATIYNKRLTKLFGGGDNMMCLDVTGNQT